MEITLNAKDIKRMLKSEEGVFAGWLERLNKNGVTDTAAAQALAESSARYNGLLSIKRGYLQNYDD